MEGHKHCGILTCRENIDQRKAEETAGTLFSKSMFAPLLIKNSTHSVWPASAAECKGVIPSYKNNKRVENIHDKTIAGL